jgi:hypothetical protein
METIIISIIGALMIVSIITAWVLVQQIIRDSKNQHKNNWKAGYPNDSKYDFCNPFKPNADEFWPTKED